MGIRRIILALDMQDKARALDVVDAFSDHIEVFKVGLELFCSAGPAIVHEIQGCGKKVFLDLKFHDIPNTVARAAVSAARMGVFMFNVHASSGSEGMRRTVGAVDEVCAKEGLERPRILGVTVLTSLGDETLRHELGVTHTLRTHVRNLAHLAQDSGLDGVVASAHEAEMIRKHLGADFLIVTPGIRPSWTPPDDQMRTMTPADAIRMGADYLVLGRSILKQPEPMRALELIAVELLTAI